MDATYDFEHADERHEYLLDLIERGREDRIKLVELRDMVRGVSTHLPWSSHPFHAIEELLYVIYELDKALHKAATLIQNLEE